MKRLHMNPVFLKELKVRARSIKLSMTLLFFNGILAVISLFSFYLNLKMGVALKIDRYEMLLGIYTLMAVMEFGMVLFMVPAFTAGSLAGERERQTLDLLLVSKTSPCAIVIGKLFSSISTVLFLILSSMPVLSIVFTIGGIGIRDMLLLLLLNFVTAVYIGSIGILFSAFSKRTVPATVLSYGAVIFLTLGTIIIMGLAVFFLQSRAEAAEIYQRTGLGNALVLFLLNPVFTMISLLGPWYGGAGTLAEALADFGRPAPFLLQNWFWLSVLVELGVSAVCLTLASRRLKPHNRRGGKQRRKKG